MILSKVVVAVVFYIFLLSLMVLMLDHAPSQSGYDRTPLCIWVLYVAERYNVC